MKSIDPVFFQNLFIVFVSLATLAGTILTIIVAWKKITEQKPTAEQYVTRLEVEKITTNLKIGLEAQHNRLEKTIKDLETYVQSHFHEFADKLAPIPVQLGVVQKQYEKLENKIDNVLIRQEHLIIGIKNQRLDARERRQHGNQPNDVHQEDNV